jgi:hypothetical protein
MFTPTARNLCFRTLLEEYFLCSNERGTLLFQWLSIWQLHFWNVIRVQSVWCFWDTIGNIDIDAASFGIKVCVAKRVFSILAFSPCSCRYLLNSRFYDRYVLESPSLRSCMIRCKTGSCSDECLQFTKKFNGLSTRRHSGPLMLRTSTIRSHSTCSCKTMTRHH